MKRLFLVLALILSYNFPAFAAGTCPETSGEISPGVRYIAFTCTADAVDNTFPAVTTLRNIEGYIFMVITNPGAPALTDDYDITLTDTDGLEVTGGLLANRDQAVTELVIPKVDLVAGLYGPRYVKGKVGLEISNNAVAGGKVVITIYIAQ